MPSSSNRRGFLRQRSARENPPVSRSARRYAAIALGLAIVVATFVFVLPRIADYADVWRVVRDLSWQQLGALAAATLVNLSTFAPLWMAALPGLHFRQAFVVTQASTASTYIAPGGPAVGMTLSYAMLRGWAFGAGAVGLARTGKLVTSAALVLMFAFFVLSSSPGVDVKQFGIGLAAGIIFDATVIRALLVPALMRLFGRWNWWMPRFAARALFVRVPEPAPERPAPESA